MAKNPQNAALRRRRMKRPSSGEAKAPNARAELNRLVATSHDEIPHPDFKKPGIEQELFGAEAVLVHPKSTRFNEQEDPFAVPLASRGRVPTLSAKQEVLLFMRFNYARMRVRLLLKRFIGNPFPPATVRQLLAWENRASVARGTIVRCNLPLVLAMAKRCRLSQVDGDEMISEGNYAVLRCVDKFDCSRGFKFSTYACRAILQDFSRVARKTARRRSRFPNEFDTVFDGADYEDCRRQSVKEELIGNLCEILRKNEARLNHVERIVIWERFSIGSRRCVESGSGKTLQQIGELLGVSKERVRQLQNTALKKIHDVLEDGYLPG